MTPHPQSLTSPASLPKRVGQSALFGPSPVLEGEDAAAYDELFARLRAAVMAVDIIDEMFIADVGYLEWEVLRLRRVKSGRIRARVLEALKTFLDGELIHRHSYTDQFADHIAYYLTKNLQVYFPDQSEDFVRTLAHKCVRNDSDALREANEVLALDYMDMHRYLDHARECKAEELVQEYVRHEPDAVMLVDKLLANAGVSVDDLVAKALADQLDYIERIDRLTAIAESRRNASLREIYRRRAVVGETLRQSVQKIEDGEFKVIETTPTKGNAT